MIFVAGTMDIDPSQIEAFEAGVAAMRDKVLAEDGCSHYSLLVENRGRGIINVVEKWRDVEALKVHFRQTWIIEFFTRFGPHVTASTIQVYNIAGEPQPLPPME